MNADRTPANAEVRTLLVPIELAGMRFDQVLAELLPEFSRSRLAAWIKSGDALLDGHDAKPKGVVRGGEQIEIRLARSTVEHARPEAIALDVLYEDAHVLVLNKAAGIVVHPGAGNPDGTLVNALLHRDPSLAALPRAGIIHRLDKDTSGALVVARSLEGHSALVEQLAAREIHRQYEAVVYGLMVAGGTVTAALDRHPVDRLKRAVIADGKEAVTHYRVRARFRAHTHVQANLETGRTHQIRVHMAHIRHPLLGDPLYGGGLKLPRAASPALIEALRGFKRQALHAEQIAFSHPTSGERLQIDAPRPTDLQTLLEVLASDLGH
ncbi:MAG: Ribosomal large subunit pseudouridine synthase D [Alphaproteobacteria bacterium ADurb.BinA280]|jgi:23S rRNA pseudouridine1911/1915/1917 synthase|nr:23S rRNA pseudouridine(1911/1915/1917) synthase RluD [Xanthomonadales bacterium]OPZ13763.1 MAG: Ribosomal large subunit pseudouridine synthase D [Alphaproteobacteria bacterium ADurb.BinA280]